MQKHQLYVRHWKDSGDGDSRHHCLPARLTGQHPQGRDTIMPSLSPEDFTWVFLQLIKFCLGF